jgi:hypothetical protein
MPRVQVWKCSTTGKLFEDKKKYVKHLKKIARIRIEDRKFTRVERQAELWWRNFQDQEFEVTDLPRLVIENQQYFWQDAKKSEPWSWSELGKIKKKVECPVPEILEFTMFSVNWNDDVSNSHHCPRNGVKNFCGGTKLPDGSPAPQGYPGWQGRAEWIVRWPREWDGWYPGSDLFKGRRSGIHSGTGGGGYMKFDQRHRCHVQSFGYDIKIFASDWPGMARVHERKLIWKILTDRRQTA